MNVRLGKHRITSSTLLPFFLRWNLILNIHKFYSCAGVMNMDIFRSKSVPKAFLFVFGIELSLVILIVTEYRFWLGLNFEFFRFWERNIYFMSILVGVRIHIPMNRTFLWTPDYLAGHLKFLLCFSYSLISTLQWQEISSEFSNGGHVSESEGIVVK